MKYDKTDIHSMQLTDFMEALGEKPVKSFENLRVSRLESHALLNTYPTELFLTTSPGDTAFRWIIR